MMVNESTFVVHLSFIQLRISFKKGAIHQSKKTKLHTWHEMHFLALYEHLELSFDIIIIHFSNISMNQSIEWIRIRIVNDVRLRI